MDYMKRDLINIFNKNNYTIDQFCTFLHEESFESAIESLNDYFKNNYDELITDKEFMYNYLNCVSDLINKLTSEEDKVLLNNHVSTIKSLASIYCKPYNKKEKKKDSFFVISNDVKKKCDDLSLFIEFKIINSDKRYENYRIMEFIVFTLKNPDYLFRILQVNPELINERNSENKHIFTVLSEQYISDCSKINEETLKYYKRIIMLMLESDCLVIKNNELNNLVAMAQKLNKNDDKNLNFYLKTVTEHFPTLNGNDRLTCIDYCVEDMAPTMINGKGLSTDRKDLTSLFTVSIDGNRNKSLANALFDDAFSLINDDNENIHLLIHVPDVDMFVPRDSDMDNYMRHFSQSVYASGYRKPLIEYDYATNMSLKQGLVRPAITFDIVLDSDANIKDVSFYKTLVNVNYNLTKDKADAFIKFGSQDERLGMLKKVMDLTTKLARKRKEKTGGKSGGKIIMDEINILPDLVTAQYALDRGIPFAYKNYLGKKKVGTHEHVRDVRDFIQKNELNEESSELILSIFDIYNRIFYDTINYGNASYHGAPCGSVGNPLREYISLESDRLISDLLIKGLGNEDYWMERIERDVIEYTETSAKLQELYGLKRGR